MNEYIQENLGQVGIKVALETVDWSTMLSRWRSGARADANKGVAAVQTNMIVQGLGGYRWSDFVRIGLAPLIVVIVVALAAIMWAFPPLR